MASSSAVSQKVAHEKRRKQELRTRREIRAMLTFRPKLSLRALLLLVLAIGSGMAFYLHFQPWAAVRFLRGHSDNVTALAWTPDGKSLVSTSRDKTARVWDVDKGATTRVLAAHKDAVTCVDVSPDGNRVVTGSADETARIWNLNTGEHIVLTNSFCGTFFSVRFSPDREFVVSATADGQARMWDTELGQQRQIFSLMKYLSGTPLYAVSAQCLDDGEILTTTSRGDVAIWQKESREPVAMLESDKLVFRAANFSSDGKHVISAGDNCTAYIWSTEQNAPGTGRKCWSAQRTATLRGHTGAMLSGYFSPDGKRALTLSADGTARLWSMDDFKPLGVLENNSSVLTAAFSPDGSRIAMNDGRQIAIWEQRRPEPLWGIIALPEFWATAIFSVWFAVIAWRDRKGIAEPAPLKDDDEPEKADIDARAETVTTETPTPQPEPPSA